MATKSLYAKISDEMYKKLQVISERAGFPVNKTVEKLIENNGTKIFDREIIKNLSKQLPRSMFLFGENQRLLYDFSVTENIENLCLAAVFSEDWSQKLLFSPSKIFFDRFPATLEYFLLQDILYNNKFLLVKSTATANELARMDALEIARNTLFDGELLEEYNKIKEDIINKYIDGIKEFNAVLVSKMCGGSIEENLTDEDKKRIREDNLVHQNKQIKPYKNSEYIEFDFGKLFEIILLEDISLFRKQTVVKRFSFFTEFVREDVDFKNYFTDYSTVGNMNTVLNPQTLFMTSINIFKNNPLEFDLLDIKKLLEHCQLFISKNNREYSSDLYFQCNDFIDVITDSKEDKIIESYLDVNNKIVSSEILNMTLQKVYSIVEKRINENRNIQNHILNNEKVINFYKSLFLFYQYSIKVDKKPVLSEYQMVNVLKKTKDGKHGVVEKEIKKGDFSLFIGLNFPVYSNAILYFGEHRISFINNDFFLFVDALNSVNILKEKVKNNFKLSAKMEFKEFVYSFEKGMLHIKNTQGDRFVFDKDETKDIIELCSLMSGTEEYKFVRELVNT